MSSTGRLTSTTADIDPWHCDTDTVTVGELENIIGQRNSASAVVLSLG